MIYRFALKNRGKCPCLSAVFGFVLVLVQSVLPAFANTQSVALSADPAAPSISESLTIGIDYSVSTGDKTLSGIGVNVYFDSTHLEFTSEQSFLDVGDIQMKSDSPGVLEDTENRDNDPATDRFIPLRWAAFEGAWPGEDLTLPVRLAELVFSPASVGSTCVKAVVVETAAGYTGAATGACVEIACPAPTITGFEVNADFILSGEKATLSWAATGALRTSIDTGIGEVTPPAGGSIEVQPAQTTVYTLTASNDCGSVTRTVTVTVASGGGSTLPILWSPQNRATGVSLMPELVAIAGSGPHVKTRWQISVSQSFEPDSLVYNEITTKYLNRIIVPPDMILKKGTRYYWRVMIHDGTQWGEPSLANSFVTVKEGPDYIDGIRADSLLAPGQEVTLGAPFATAEGAPVNTDTIKVFRSVVRPQVQIGLQVEGGIIEKCGAIHPDAFAGQAKNTPILPLGLIEISINVPFKGDSAVASLFFSEPLEADFIWWKYDPNLRSYYDYAVANPEGHLQVSPDRMSLKIVLKDGGPGDLIANPDGRIIDPSGPGGIWAGGGGGGGSCFIGTASR